MQGADSLEEVMERGIMFAHRSIVEHEVLQRVMQTEPEKLLPALTFESNRIREGITDVPRPLPGAPGLAAGVDLHEAADFLARMILSYMASPGRWDLDDPAQVAQLVEVGAAGRSGGRAGRSRADGTRARRHGRTSLTMRQKAT